MAGVRHSQAPKSQASVRGQRTNLFSLPAEIHVKIFAIPILEAKERVKGGRGWREGKKRARIDITVARGQPPRWWGGGKTLPYVIDQLKQLLEAFAGTPLESRIAEQMGREFKFESDLCESLRRLPGVLKPTYMRYIQRLSLYMDEGMEDGHEKIWPQFIFVICTELPNLSKLTIENDHDRYARLLFEADYTTAHASLLRLMSFIAIQMKEDFRLILPAGQDLCKSARVKLFLEKVVRPSADSKWLQARLGHPSSDEAPREWKSVAQYMDVGESDFIVAEDEVLNATAIRHLTMSELESSDPFDFIINPEPGSTKNALKTSEIPEARNFYEIVDKRGYRTRETHRANNWKMRSVDEMILFCRQRETVFMKRQKRERKDAARRDRRALRDLSCRGLNIHAPVFTPVTDLSPH